MIINLTDQDDIYTGTPGDDVIHGLAGNDTIGGGGGLDTIYGDAGDDILYEGRLIFGGDGNDELFASDDGVELSGDAGDDLFHIDYADTQAFGGDGADFFDISGNGGAILTGGAGIDRFSPNFYDYSFSAMVADFTAGRGGDIVDLTESVSHFNFPENGNPFGKQFFWIQDGDNAVLTYDEFWFLPRDRGSTFSEVLVLKNVAATQLLSENVGGYTPLPIEDYGNKIKGTAGSDVRVGTAGDDGIQGLGGNDTLSGGDGDDIILGGGGNDRLDGGAGHDRLDGGDGNDVLTDTGGGLNSLYGGNGNDDITLVDGRFSIVDGGAGNDIISVTDSTDSRISGGTGNDTIVVHGSAGAQIDAGPGNDTVVGGSGDDTITGGAGRDILSGDVGTPSLGADRFVFASVTDSPAGRNADRITDFLSGKDTIDLSGIDANSVSPGEQAFAFIGTAAFSGLGQLRLDTSVAGQISVLGNATGDLHADFQIVLAGASVPVVTDFFL